MLKGLGYVLILGKPVIFYLGITTFLSFCFTALIGFLNYHGNHKIPFKWHPVMAATSITLAIIHGILSILAYL